MHFLLIAFDFPPTIGGIQTRAKHYVKNLVKTGHRITIIHLLSPEVQFEHFASVPVLNGYVEKYSGAVVWRFSSSIKKMFHVFLKATRYLKSARIDVVHVISGASTPIGLLFLIYGKLKRAKTGVSFYGKDILDSSHIYKLFQLISMVITDRIGVNSKATLKLIPKLVRSKIVVLYPGVDIQTLSKLKHEWKRKDKGKEILFVGRLVKRKAAHELLRAFKLVLEKMPNTKLTIVGDGPQRETLTDIARSLAIQDKVEFTGTLVGEPLWERYQECDVFVMPSKRTERDVEGFGVVFLEAGFFKKPCIGTWSGGIPEAIIHNKTGLLVPQGDEKALAEAITLLLTNENLAKRLGEKAHNRVVSKFTWEKATLDFLNMYQDEFS